MWPKLAGKWLRLDRAQRLILLEAAWTLAAAQLAVRLLPFRWIAPRLGRVGSVTSERPLNSNEQWQAQQVGWAIMNLARFLPWDARCLAQAVAGKWMLRRRGLPSTLYLGVDRGRESWLEAHAWLRCGTKFVTGQRQHERFTVLATFVEEQP